MDKPRLNPPPPIYDPSRAQDKFIARVTEINPLEKPDLFAGCKNGSDRLLRMVEIADESGIPGLAYNFNRP